MKLLATAACALAALTLSGPASAGVGLGVAADSPKYADDGGGAFFAELSAAGLTETRITVPWDADRPRQLTEKGFLDRMFPKAEAHGIRIIFSVYPTKARALASPAAAKEFSGFVALLARTYPQVSEYIIGNEFNVSRFFQPQFTSACKGYSGGAYMRLLAASYDALKAVNPAISVSTSVSPRGNDTCSAASNISISPCRFVHDMGVAFRAMHRMQPSFDEWASHVYPQQATDPLMKGYPWPNVGVSNLGRLKQCISDAFEDTAQPTFERTLRLGQSVAALKPMSLNLAEVGWQVGVLPSAKDAYYGKESVKVTDEASQAQIYGDLVRFAVCDSAVGSVLFFGLGDEANLDRFQSGLVRADGTRRPSFDSVRNAITETGGDCSGTATEWHPAETVTAAKADFQSALGPKPAAQKYWGFQATAQEDSTYSAGIFRVAGPNGASGQERAAMERSLAGSAARKPVLSAQGKIKAYWSPIVRFPSRKLTPGYYAYGITIRAALNPDRDKLFVSKAFKVGTPRK